MVTVRKAVEEDEAQLAQLYSKNDMKGEISLSLETPQFFESLKLYTNPQVWVAQKEDGHIVASAMVSEKDVYLDGKVACVGYLSGLRIDESARGGTLLARAYRMLAKMREEHPGQVMFTTIMSDNPARAILESGRAGLPEYRRVDTIDVFTLAPQPMRKGHKGLSIIDVDDEDELTDDLIDETIAYVDDDFRAYDFAPHLTKESLQGLPGFDARRFSVALVDGRIAGAVASWKPAGKQTRVTGYSTRLSLARPFANPLLSLLNYPRLPEAGSVLDSGYLSFLSAKTPEALDALIAHSSQDHMYSMFGLTHSDPRHDWMRRHAITRSFELYTVGEPHPAPSVGSAARPTLLEVALL